MKKLILFLCLIFPLSAFSQVVAGNITILGASCAVTNACVILQLATNSSSASLTLTGTWSATVQFEASSDGGTTWVAINGTPPSSTTAVTSSTANGVWTFNVGSMTHIRARASALASGTVGVNIQASPAPIMAAGGGGGGSGTVTSVLGTANQITSDGSTTTPTLSIPSTFIAPGSIAATTTIASGTTPASTGQIRIPNNTSISWRNAANNADFPITYTSSNQLNLGSGLGTVILIAGGSGTPTFDGTNNRMNWPTGWALTWNTDTAFSRDAAGVVDVGTGAASSEVGLLRAGNSCRECVRQHNWIRDIRR